MRGLNFTDSFPESREVVSNVVIPGHESSPVRQHGGGGLHTGESQRSVRVPPDLCLDGSGHEVNH